MSTLLSRVHYPAFVAHLGVGPRVREGRTHVPRRPLKDCEPSLCHHHQHRAC